MRRFVRISKTLSAPFHRRGSPRYCNAGLTFFAGVGGGGGSGGGATAPAGPPPGAGGVAMTGEKGVLF